MVSFGDVCDIVFSTAVLVYVITSWRQNNLLKEQNKQLSELLLRTNDAANIMKNFRNGNKRSEEDKRSATEDGNREGNSGSDSEE